MKFNFSLEGLISMLILIFLSHFFPIQLAQGYLVHSFLVLLLPLESFSKLYSAPKKIVTYGLSYLSVPSNTHKPRLGDFPV